ncbi:MAG: type II secretion system protein [Armatimonadota bacterium]
MILKRERGFTIIELLTVIAIIAILAAIIFPVMSAARRQAKKTQCISNLAQVHRSVKLFEQDEHRFPEFIAGPVEFDGSGAVVPIDKSRGMVDNRLVSLYPEYIKSIDGLRCPESVLNGEGLTYSTTDWISDPVTQILIDQGLTNQLRVSWDSVNGVSMYKLYKYSSYDYQAPPGAVSPEAHYSTAWMFYDPQDTENTNEENNLGPRQLHWRNPPEDTVITWCSHHRDVAGDGTLKGGSKDLVLFLDGRVKLLKSADLATWTDAWKVTPD